MRTSVAVSATAAQVARTRSGNVPAPVRLGEGTPVACLAWPARKRRTRKRRTRSSGVRSRRLDAEVRAWLAADPDPATRAELMRW